MQFVDKILARKKKVKKKEAKKYYRECEGEVLYW